MSLTGSCFSSESAPVALPSWDAKCRAGHSRLRSPSTVAACDVSAASAVSDSVSSLHAPDDKAPPASSARCRAHRCGPMVLFVAEPLVLHRWLLARAKVKPEAAFRFLEWLHWVWLILSLATVAGAVAGTHGVLLFE